MHRCSVKKAKKSKSTFHGDGVKGPVKKVCLEKRKFRLVIRSLVVHKHDETKKTHNTSLFPPFQVVGQRILKDLELECQSLTVAAAAAAAVLTAIGETDVVITLLVDGIETRVAIPLVVIRSGSALKGLFGCRGFVVAADEALQGRRVKRERATHERQVERALNFASNFVLDVVDHGVQVAGIRVVRSLVRAS